MSICKKFFTVSILGAFICTSASGANCTSAAYRAKYPEKCSFFIGTGTAVFGGLGAVGGALAAFAFASSGGGGGSSSDNGATIPTLQSSYMVGGDVDSIQLAAATGTSDYTRNSNQYDEIRLGYSLARGFTGRGSTIAVLDAGEDTAHGKHVAYFASTPIAPNAVVNSYKIADDDMKFLPYAQIGAIIDSISDADIFNASWSVSMRATDIKSRHQLESLTDKGFIDALSRAAHERDAIFVWAAGNDYDHRQSSALSAMPLFVSELRGHFINVVAWDNQTGALADFSNACGITKDYCITAPGTNLATEYGFRENGTSFAAPLVSAAVAVLKEAFPYMTASEITSLLFETARDLGAPGVDEIYGHGMLDMERATRPVGAPLVPINDNVMQPLRTARVSGVIGHSIKSADLKFASFDKYGRPFVADLSSNIKIKNQPRAFERLRAINKTQGATIGNFEFGFKHSDLILGDGFLQTQKNNLISFVGAHNEFMLGDVQIFQRIQVGFAAPQSEQNSMITGFSGVNTMSAELGAKYGNWKFGIAIPDTIISGKMNLRLPVGRADNGAIIHHNYNIDMAIAPAVEYSVGYGAFTASFIDNPYGTDEFFVIAKKSLIF